MSTEQLSSQPSVSAQTQLALGPTVVWSLGGNLAWAVAQWLLFVALTRTGSPETPGAFALALAVNAPIFTLLGPQLRTLHATDAKDVFSFGDYVSARLITVTTALFVSILVGVTVYGGEMALLIAVVALARTGDAAADTIYGVYQKEERLDLIAKSMTLRAFAGVAIFTILLLQGFSLVPAVVGMTIAGLIMMAAVDVGVWRTLGLKRRYPLRLRPSASTAVLIRTAAPLAVAAFLASLQINVPRYSIETIVGKDDLGFYAVVAQLVLPVALIATASGAATAARMSVLWATRDIAALRKLLLVVLSAVSAAGALGIGIAFFAGSELLSLVYGPAYSGFATLLALLMTAATLQGLANVFGGLVTAARQLHSQLIVHLFTLMLLAIGTPAALARFGLLGAGFIVLATSAFVLICYAILAARTIGAKGST